MKHRLDAILLPDFRIFKVFLSVCSAGAAVLLYASRARVYLFIVLWCMQNIEVKSNVPGVGRNLRDHPAVSESCPCFLLCRDMIGYTRYPSRP